MKDIDIWVKQFGLLTNTKWNSRKSNPKGKQMLCMKTFVCQHSSFMKVPRDKNKRTISKNANCNARIHIKIKLTTRDTIRKDLYMKDGLPAIVSINKRHSHPQNRAQSLHFLQNHVQKEKFIEYFFNGMTPFESKRYHESILESIQTCEEDMSNQRINPSLRTINYWFDEWRALNLSPRTGSGVVEKLREKIPEYEDKGHTVVFTENPFSVVILTAIRKRSHTLDLAKDIVFCDTTSSCDPLQHSITFLLTSCPAGATPLGVLITQGQSEAAYATAFNLLKNTLPNAFKNQGYPSIFITDNSRAEKDGIKTVWLQSGQLLCIFYVLQAVWRWLWDAKNCIPYDRRQKLMKCFQTLLYCENLTLIDACLEEGDNLIQWKYYMEFYYSFKEEWCLAYRNSSSRGHHTNNYSEVSVRIFKDIVLSRVKTYNTIALIDYCCTALESFYKSKFRAFCNFEKRSSHLFFKSYLKKTQYLNKDEIMQIDENIFLVPSEADHSSLYTVDINIGCCTCRDGKFGTFCKHQCAVYQFFDLFSHNFPAITHDDRFMLACVAFNENERPPRSFYANFHCNDNENHSTIESTNQSFLNQLSFQKFKTMTNSLSISMKTFDVSKEYELNEELEKLTNSVCVLFREKIEALGNNLTPENMKKFIKRLGKIETEGQLETFLAASTSYIKKNPKHGTLKAQSTSISRRKAGITRGCKRLAARKTS